MVRPVRSHQAASARRHRLADTRVTRNRLATSRSLAPSSIHSAAASRTRSRQAARWRPARHPRGTSCHRHSAGGADCQQGS